MFGHYFRLDLSSKSDFIAFGLDIVFNMHLLVYCEYIISLNVVVSLVVVYVG